MSIRSFFLGFTYFFFKTGITRGVGGMKTWEWHKWNKLSHFATQFPSAHLNSSMYNIKLVLQTSVVYESLLDSLIKDWQTFLSHVFKWVLFHLIMVLCELSVNLNSASNVVLGMHKSWDFKTIHVCAYGLYVYQCARHSPEGFTNSEFICSSSYIIATV